VGSIPLAAQFDGFISLRPDEAELLGAPLLSGKKMDEPLANPNRCSELDTALGRLSLLAAHDALILLKASFSAPKMLHTLRCSPCTNHPSLAVFDDFLRKGIFAICNLDLSDPQWLQASLPVKDGGLGVRFGLPHRLHPFFSVCCSYRNTPSTAPSPQSSRHDY